jgi:xylulokinase
MGLKRDASPLVAGLDLGTSRLKAAVYTLHGEELARAYAPVKTYRPCAGWHEQDPSEWRQLVHDALRRVSKQLGRRHHAVRAIGVSAHGPGLVLLDRELNPLIRCPTWQDLRSAKHGQRLMRDVGLEWIGLGLPETGLPSKLAWAIEHQTEKVAASEYILGVKGYIISVLTGRFLDEPSSCSVSGGWSQEVFDYLGIPPERLAEIVPSDVTAGPITPEVAHITGMPLDTQVVPGLNDGASACLGSGLLDVGQGIVSLSTNAVARCVVPQMLNGDILLEHSLFCYPYIEGVYIGGGFTKCGGDSLRWFLEVVKGKQTATEEGIENFSQEAAQSPAGAKGVIFLPQLAGQGTPHSDDTPSGAFVGLDRHHKRHDMVRAVLEGVAFALRDISLVFEKLGWPWSDLRLTGSGGRNPVWGQILADVLARPMTGMSADSVLGAAIIATVATGLHASYPEAVEAMIKPGGKIQPISKYIELYNQSYHKYQAYHSAIRSLKSSVSGTIAG